MADRTLASDFSLIHKPLNEVDILTQKSIGQTLKNAVTNDVEGFGRGIDPVNDARARAHTEVIRYGPPLRASNSCEKVTKALCQSGLHLARLLR